MSAKKSYNRFFIIFQEEDKGYGIGPDRPPTGYVKVETKGDKGKVTVYVQNLKPFENGECLYKCYLISHQDNRDDVVYLGIMNIDEFGRGESSWESGADNAFDSKVPVEKFNAAAIIAEGNGISSLVAPLAGYMSKEKFEWRSKIPVKQQNVKVEVLEDTLSQKASEESQKFEAYERQVEEIAGRAQKAQPEEEIARQAEEIESKPEEVEKSEVEIARQAEEIENKPPEVAQPEVESARQVEEIDGKSEEKEQIEASRKPVEVTDEKVAAATAEERIFTEDKNAGNNSIDGVELDRKHKHSKEYDDYNKNKYKNKHNCCNKYGNAGYSHYDFRKMLKKFLEDILEDYDEVDLGKALKGCRMWKVDMKKFSKDMHKIYKFPCYDLIFYPMMNNPYCNYNNYIRKHGYYLFGIKYDDDKNGKEVKKIVFGIPGANTIKDQPFQGVTGFVTWVPSKDNYFSDGYWIMTYDPMTGLVTLPDE